MYKKHCKSGFFNQKPPSFSKRACQIDFPQLTVTTVRILCWCRPYASDGKRFFSRVHSLAPKHVPLKMWLDTKCRVQHTSDCATQVMKAPPPPLPEVYSDEATALARWLLQKDPLRRPTLTQVSACGHSFRVCFLVGCAATFTAVSWLTLLCVYAVVLFWGGLYFPCYRLPCSPTTRKSHAFADCLLYTTHSCGHGR